MSRNSNCSLGPLTMVVRPYVEMKNMMDIVTEEFHGNCKIKS